MQTDDLILAEEFCVHNKVELSFITYLKEFGLIEITSVEERYYIPTEQLRKLEQLIRLHYDLNINLEGIDAIVNLLERIKSLQIELANFKNRLRLYEHV